MFEKNQLPSNIKELVTEEEITSIWHEVYRKLMISLDAIDNGIQQYPRDVKPAYPSSRTDLPSRVSRLNTQWWEDANDTDVRFVTAMDLCEEEFRHSVMVSVIGSVASIPIVKASIADGLKADGQILVLQRSCFWKEALFKIEEQTKTQGQIKYVVFNVKNTGEWRIQAVPVEISSFESRVPLNEPWRGKSNQDLAEVSGLEDAVFCHHSGFIGGCKGFENTLKMGLVTLEKVKTSQQ